MGSQKANVRSTLVRAKYVKGEATLEKIREAALEEITLRGYHRTSVCEIVRRANLTRGAFYNYWNSLDDCVADLIVAVRDKLKNDPDGIEYAESLKDPSRTVRKIRVALYLILEKGRRDPYLPITLLHEKDLPGDDLRVLLEDYVRIVKAEWAAVIEADQADGIIRADLKPQSVAAGIMNIVAGIVQNAELKYIEMGRRTEEALVLFLRGCFTPAYAAESCPADLVPRGVSYEAAAAVS